MLTFHHQIIFIVWIALLMQTAYASHESEVGYRAPETIITTVGKLTTVQIDITNKASSPYSFQINLRADQPNEMEITNSNIDIMNVKPGEAVSVFSNIRTLTETSNSIIIEIKRGDDHPITKIISVRSKKFSLSEFGLAGLLQIMAIVGILYFLLIRKK